MSTRWKMYYSVEKFKNEVFHTQVKRSMTEFTDVKKKDY